MTKINWKVRAKNKTFWLAIIPALLLVVQIVGEWFGYKLATDYIGEQATEFIKAVFLLLTVLGVVEDPTTKGVGDSEQALTYEEPKGDR